jgi:hypothetical protein
MRQGIARTIALLLILSGVGGLVAVWMGWRMTGEVIGDLRDVSTQLAPEQAQVVSDLREAAAMVDDAAEAVDGFAAGMTRARTAASQAADASGDLALSFERMREVTQIQVGGQQPLEGLSEPFAASSLSFRRLSGSLAQMADALDNSALDTARVADDLQMARNRMDNMAATVEALRPRLLAGRGLSSLELGMRSVLAFILVQAVLSMLTGLAILLLSGSKRASE